MFHIHSFSASSVTGATVTQHVDKYWYPEVHTHQVCACGVSKVRVTKLPFVLTESLAWRSVVAYLRIVASQNPKHTLIVAMAELNVLFDQYAEKVAAKEAQANVPKGS